MHETTSDRDFSVTDRLEIINFFRIRLCMLLHKSKPKRKFEDYYKDSQLKRTDWIPLFRFKKLHATARANIDTLAQLLRNQSFSTFSPSQVFAIDELLVAFRSNKSKLIVKYPDKPHTTGYLIYIMSALSQRCDLPIMFDVSPISSYSQTSLHYQVKQFAMRLTCAFPFLRNRVHLVTDSAFGSVDMVQLLKTMGVFMTTLLRKAYSKKVWDAMNYKMKGYSNGRMLYQTSMGMMYNLIIKKKELRILSSSFGKKVDNANRTPVSHSMMTQILELKEKLTVSNQKRDELLRTISTSGQTDSRSLARVLSSVSFSMKKLNRDDNKVLNQLNNATAAIAKSGKIEKVLRCIDINNNKYEVQLANGHLVTRTSNSMVGYNGHIIPPFLKFGSREHFTAHFRALDLAALKRVSAHLGFGRGLLVISYRQIDISKFTHFSNVLGYKKGKIVEKIVENTLRLKASQVEMLRYKLRWKLGKSYKAVTHTTSIPTLPNQTSVAPCQLISSFYCRNFNRVDRFNARWYSIKWVHVHKKKKPHMTWALVHAAIVNAWVAMCELKGPKIVRAKKVPPISIIDFIRSLHSDMCKYIVKKMNKHGSTGRKRSRSIASSSKRTPTRKTKRKK